MRNSLLAALSSLVAVSAALAADGTVDIAAPESVVHTAPFDVAPELARVHAGDKLSGEPDAQSGWLRIQLPDSRRGFLHASDARFTAGPVQAVTQAPPMPGDAPAAPTTTPARSGDGSVLLGVAFSLLPAGTLTTSAQGKTTDVAADVTGALAPSWMSG